MDKQIKWAGAAVLLFAIAYGWHAQVLIRLGWKRIGLATAIAATTAFGLFATALFLDGFIVPATIESYLSAAGGQPTTLEQVADSHSFALRFFTPAVFLTFVAAGLLSSPMLHRVIHVGEDAHVSASQESRSSRLDAPYFTAIAAVTKKCGNSSTLRPQFSQLT